MGLRHSGRTDHQSVGVFPGVRACVRYRRDGRWLSRLILTFGRPGVPPLRNSRRASGFVVGADDLGGPRAHCVRPYREKKRRAVNVLWEGESPRRFAPPFDKGGLCGRTFLRPKRCRSRAHPHPPRCARHLSPRRGKAYGGRKGRPYDRKRTGSVGSVKPGAAVELYQPSILGQPGPSGPVGI